MWCRGGVAYLATRAVAGERDVGVDQSLERIVVEVASFALADRFVVPVDPEGREVVPLTVLVLGPGGGAWSGAKSTPARAARSTNKARAALSISA